MGHAVEKLHDRLMEISRVDDDGVYRYGAEKRSQRSELVKTSLKALWQEASAEVDFDLPESGVGLAAVGSLARGQMGPNSDLDLVLMVEDRALKQEQLARFADRLWYPLWDSGLDLDHSVRTRSQCESSQ